MFYTEKEKDLANVDDFLLCGKNISGTHIAYSNYRAMPICVGIGEDCGIVVAIAYKKDLRVRDVSVAEIQIKLL